VYRRLLDFLRCPDCGGRLEAAALRTAPDGEISEGILNCSSSHGFPIVRGIPRLLSDSLFRHAEDLAPLARVATDDVYRRYLERKESTANYDRGTKANFDEEWHQHCVGDRTWSMDLASRVEAFFLEPMRIPREELAGKLVLDAGCGNGSQSVAYTQLGCEVIAVDISSGVEHGHRFRRRLEGAVPDKVHFVQADLERPPFAPQLFDIIHSAGVLHHTPDTRRTFESLVPLLKNEGTLYVWLYKYETIVTPILNGIRFFTTSIPSSIFSRLALLLAPAFRVFCATTNALGIRAYASLNRREARLALMDIFGVPYAHYHTYEEVADWYRVLSFTVTWSCNEGRRGFGVCGRLGLRPENRARAGASTAVDTRGDAVVPARSAAERI